MFFHSSVVALIWFGSIKCRSALEITGS